MSKVTETWLSDPASIKGILVEVIASIYDSVNLVWVETPLYLSNIGYLTTDNLTMFNPIIVGGLQITESISLEGSISMSFGDIGLSNPNGELDNWLDSTRYIWTNRTVKVYIGDPSWVCTSLAQIHTDFELVFSGLASDIDASSREQVNLKVRDSLERLNTPLTEVKLGTYGTWAGGQTNQDTIKPVVLGEVFNITPLLIDPSQLEYMYNNPISLTLANITQTNPPNITDQTQLAITTWGTSLIRAIAWNGTTYCIVGDSGKVATSPDGITWTVQMGTWGTTQMNGIAWNGTVFCAVGGTSTGITATSPDGVTWTNGSTIAGNGLCIVWNSTIFCIGGGNGRFYTSTTGTSTWTEIVPPTWGTATIDDLSWSGTTWCAVGQGGRCATSSSTTAASWAYQASLATAVTSSTVTKITWAGSQFCAGSLLSKIATSPNGITWTARTGLSTLWAATPEVKSLTWTGTKIIALGTLGKLAYSTDGITWVDNTELINSTWGTNNGSAINWNGVKLLIAGSSGKVATTTHDIPTGLVEIVCDNTASLSINLPITFTGTSFGGITTGTTYYIKSIPMVGIITLANTSGGSNLTFTTATGILSIPSSVGSEQVIEIRDNGVPIYNSTITTGATINLTAGTFKLLKNPIGVITMSVQGTAGLVNLSTKAISAVYKNTLANIIALICINYGKATTRLNVNELDLVNLNTFDLANPTPIGYCVPDRENILTTCQNILSSIGAQLYITKKGLLQILQIGVPTSDIVVNITDNDIIQHSLSISNKLAVVPSNKLGYAKNWTVQANLVTTIPDAHKATFTEEWLTTTSTDTVTSALYNLTADPIEKDTMLITNIAAYTESVRLTNYYKTARVVYKFTGTARLFILKLGQSVFLTHNRFNLSNGKTGQVTSLSYDWIAGTVNVEVLI